LSYQKDGPIQIPVLQTPALWKLWHHLLTATSIHVTELDIGILGSTWGGLIIAASGILQEEFHHYFYQTSCFGEFKKND